jgi:oligopeptide/dipeptide ABC transporter ATP-binding protein
VSLLRIRDLTVCFHSGEGDVLANDHIDLDLEEGGSISILGETGCGKTVLERAMLRLLSPGARVCGSIVFDGREVLTLSQDEMCSVRGRGMAMVMQNPSASLNPLMRVVDQVAEVYELVLGLDRRGSLLRAGDMLERVGIDAGRQRDFPHQFSGGMRQRVMLAIAFSLSPRLLVADEPTKGLDEEMKGDILELMNQLREESGCALMVITHDFDVARSLCDRAAVMYAGQIVEMRPILELMENPIHPYTEALVRALHENGFLSTMGETPALSERARGCRYADRCPFRSKECDHRSPEPKDTGRGWVRCVREGSDAST